MVKIDQVVCTHGELLISHVPPRIICGVCGASATISEVVELNALFEMQQKRMGEAIKLWQKRNPGNDLVWPDLGRLLTWLMEQVEPVALLRLRVAALALLRALSENTPGYAEGTPELTPWDDECLALAVALEMESR